MAGTAVTQQSPVPLRQANQIQATGDKNVDEEVVPEEAVTNYVAEESYTSTAHHAHNKLETSREKLRILAGF